MYRSVHEHTQNWWWDETRSPCGGQPITTMANAEDLQACLSRSLTSTNIMNTPRVAFSPFFFSLKQRRDLNLSFVNFHQQLTLHLIGASLLSPVVAQRTIYSVVRWSWPRVLGRWFSFQWLHRGASALTSYLLDDHHPRNDRPRRRYICC